MLPVQMEDNPYNPANFVGFALLEGVLKFGDHTTKAGRKTPYLFNADDFYSSTTLAQLGHFYANLLLRRFTVTDNDLANELEGTILFGPTHKGIGLVYTVATILGESYGIKVDVAYTSECGTLVGTKMEDRFVIMFNETKIEAVKLITDAGGHLMACVIAFDQQEKGVAEDGGVLELSAAQDFTRKLGVPMHAIATCSDMIRAFDMGGIEGVPPVWNEYIDRIKAYRDQYGAAI